MERCYNRWVVVEQVDNERQRLRALQNYTCAEFRANIELVEPSGARATQAQGAASWTLAHGRDNAPRFFSKSFGDVYFMPGGPSR